MAPWVRRTWSPIGRTPVLAQRVRHHKKASVIAGLCVSPSREHVRLYFRLHADTNITAETVADFLRALDRQLRSPMVLLWDRLAAHRGRAVKHLLAQRPHIHPEFLPPYAPELNPVEGVWAYLKTNPLANFAPLELDELTDVARRAGRSLQRKPDLLRSFIHKCPLPLRLE